MKRLRLFSKTGLQKNCGCSLCLALLIYILDRCCVKSKPAAYFEVCGSLRQYNLVCYGQCLVKVCVHVRCWVGVYYCKFEF